MPRVLEVRDIISAVMVVCNPLAWEGSAADITTLHKAGIGIIAMKPMMGGLSSDFVPKEKKAWLDSLDTEARRQAALAAALKWVLKNENVDTAPVLMSTLDHIERSVKAAAEPFTETDRRLLVAAAGRISPFYCRTCQRCEGTCRQGLPVSDVIRSLMYAQGYGNMPKARGEFQQLPASLQAVRCGDCAECTVRCPNGVRVREQMARAQTLLA
jgi:uncharacterized protein